MKRIWFKTPSFRQFFMFDEGGADGTEQGRCTAAPLRTIKRPTDAPRSSVRRLLISRAQTKSTHTRRACTFSRTFVRAFDRYGYYVAVGICALMVFAGALAGVTGYGTLDAVPEPTPAINTQSITGDVSARQASAEFAPIISAAPKAETPSPRLDVWPLEGDIITAHETKRLIYLETLAQYGTHAGIDIAAARGQVVVACTDGYVVRCWRESMLGNVIEIRSDGGILARYANLQSLDLVKEGDAVSAGEAIGAVGASAMSESLMQPHLHFEVLIDGESVPPLDVLPIR